MGSRSKARARAKVSQVSGQPSPAPQQQPPCLTPPRTVQTLALVEAIEALGLLVASALAAVDTGTGQSYQLASGIAITVIGVCAAVGLALVARGLRRGRRWTRTPALLTQLFTGIIGIYLIQGSRYEWGIPALLLALVGFAMLMAPASVKLLTPGRVEKPGQR